MSERVTDLVKDIRTNLKQRSASQKDEVKVMKAMLNDKDFRVGEYTREGKVGEYSPYEDSRKMVSTILSSAAKIPSAEAKEIANKYEFGKSEATTMINLSKEFVNTYVHTGRKLPLGGREDMNVAVQLKEVPELVKMAPIFNMGDVLLKLFESDNYLVKKFFIWYPKENSSIVSDIQTVFEPIMKYGEIYISFHQFL